MQKRYKVVVEHNDYDVQCEYFVIAETIFDAKTIAQKWNETQLGGDFFIVKTEITNETIS